MSAEVRFVVCGRDEAGFEWYAPTDYATFEEADGRAEREAEHEAEVWVEKHTTYKEIVKSISGPGLPDNPALIPA